MYKYRMVETETGEIVSEFNSAKIITDTQNKIIKKHYENTEFKSVQGECSGQFIMFIYSNLDKLSLVLKNEDITKLMFIATYTDYKGTLAYDNGRKLTKKDLIKLLKINNKSFYEFLNTLIDNGILKEQQENYIINTDYFIKGKLNNKAKFIKLYINAIRTIYQNATIRQHNRLSVIFRLIPYVNYKHSILCKNPNEEQTDKVKPLTTIEIAKMLSFASTQKLTNFLFEMTYNDYPVFMLVKNKEEHIVINPIVMHKGEDVKHYRELINLFEIIT